MQEKSPRLQAALAFAKTGIPIFPCYPDSKKPATEHGFKDATTDLGQIERWWQEADYNLAFCPHDVGWSIVDPDGPEGMAAWEKLLAEHGPIETYTVATPRGGQHLYFYGELPMTRWFPGATRCLGTHIDTRGVGSYALLPPSTFEGKPYRVQTDADVTDLPAWIQRAVGGTHQRLEAVAGEPDSPAALSRARAFLTDCRERGDVAVEGQGGNNRTYQLAASLQNLGISPGSALDLIEELWNPECLPPWEHEELEQLVSHAYSYAQNELGAWAAPSLAEGFGSAVAKLPDLPVEDHNPYRALDIDEQDNAPDPTWLIPGLIPERATVLIVGKSGSFKSFIVEDIALAIASGTTTFGSVPEKSGKVFFAAGEGQNEVQKGRKQAWLKARGVDREKLRGRFLVMPAPLVASKDQQELFREAIRNDLRRGSERIRLLVIDTTAEAMTGMDGSSDRDAGLFVHFCRQLVREFDCSVIAVHHYGKDPTQGARGSSALPAGFDTRIEVERVEDTNQVQVKVTHHKNFPTPRSPWYFEGQQVGDALVFNTVDRRAHQIAVAEADIFDHAKVATALVHMGAIGFQNGVTSAVLARELVPAGENRTVEENEDALDRNARALDRLGRGKLAGYCKKLGRANTWFIPTEVAPTVLEQIPERG